MNKYDNKIKYFEAVKNTPREVYYHYTSLESLYEIITSHTFRLMSLKSTNDRNELFYNYKTFINDIESIYEKEEESNIKKYYELVLYSIEKHYELVLYSIEKHKEEFKKHVIPPSKPFSLCLSTKRDNLTHWDRYANNCKGVCIAFNFSSIKSYYYKIAPTMFEYSCLDIGKILYSQNEIEKYIKDSRENNGLIFKDIYNYSNNSSSMAFLEDSLYFLQIILCNRIIKFAKNTSFIDEDEVRLYHDTNSYENTLHFLSALVELDKELYTEDLIHFIEIGNKFIITQDNYAITKSGIREYRNLCLDEIWGSGIIPEIIIGPQCTQNRRELQHFLKHNGLEGTKVTISKVPIR